MKENSETSTRRTWQTIDYIGGGFVLQKKMEATVEKTFRHNYRKDRDDFQSADVVDVEPAFECDTEVRESSYGNKGRIQSVHQPHRVVHLSELEGVDMATLVQEVEERGGLK